MSRSTFDGTYIEEEYEPSGECEMYSITLNDIEFGYTPPERGYPESPDYPAEFEFIEAQDVKIEKYYDDSNKTFLISNDSNEFKIVLDEFLDKHIEEIETYIEENPPEPDY